MAKNTTNKDVENVENVEVNNNNDVENSTKKTSVKENKSNKNNKKNKKEKKPAFRKLKETTSELKKVSWPSFGKVVKQTGVVILVVAICTLLLFGIDRLFSLIYGLLTK